MAVIAIVALLVSILLPVLAAAREQARSVVCQSNIRQICQAVLAYATDFDGALPNPYEDIARPYEGSAIQMDARGKYNWQIGRLWPYLPAGLEGRRRVFNCPTDDADPRFAGVGNGANPLAPDPLHPRNFSFNFNWEMLSEPDMTGHYTALLLTQVRQPWHKLMILEMEAPFIEAGGVASAAGGVTPNSQVACLLTARHRGLAHVGMFDFHVEALDPLAFANNAPTVYTKAYVHYVVLQADQ